MLVGLCAQSCVFLCPELRRQREIKLCSLHLATPSRIFGTFPTGTRMASRKKTSIFVSGSMTCVDASANTSTNSTAKVFKAIPGIPLGPGALPFFFLDVQKFCSGQGLSPTREVHFWIPEGTDLVLMLWQKLLQFLQGTRGRGE